MELKTKVNTIRIKFFHNRILLFFLGIALGAVITFLIFSLLKTPGSASSRIPFKMLNLFELSGKGLDLKFSDSEMTTLVTTKNYDLSLIKVYQDVNLHKHPEDHILIVLSGEGMGGGEGGETFKIGPGSYAQVPRGGAHSLINTGKEPLVILQLSTPPFNNNKIQWIE